MESVASAIRCKHASRAVESALVSTNTYVTYSDDYPVETRITDGGVKAALEEKHCVLVYFAGGQGCGYSEYTFRNAEMKAFHLYIYDNPVLQIFDSISFADFKRKYCPSGPIRLHIA
jgi:hypothetical protein